MDKKLLIIEDDPYIMRALSSILEIEGYALDCVTTGADALSKARSDPGSFSAGSWAAGHGRASGDSAAAHPNSPPDNNSFRPRTGK